MEPTPTRPAASTRILELIDIKMNTQEIVNNQQPTKSQVMKTTSDLIFLIPGHNSTMGKILP